MKRYLIYLTLFIFACSENDDPAPVDLFLGQWEYQNSGMGLAISFNVKKGDAGYLFENISITYADIPADAVFNMEVHDKFTDNSGFGRIRISGAWTLSPCETMFCDKWVSINLYYNSLTKVPTGSRMTVHEMQLDMINREQVILEDIAFEQD